MDEQDTISPEPQFDIPEQLPERASGQTAKPDASSDKKSTASHQPGKTAERPAKPRDDYVKTPDIHIPASHKAGTIDDVVIPEMLIEESGSRAGLLSRLFWSIGAIGLLLAGTIMVIWFQRDLVLSRYPQLIPWAHRLCEKMDCKVIRFRDVTAIELINRDVRDHPRYENALLVNATMRNNAHTRQPFPDIQLSLYDTNGALIAHRIFVPDDYLDDSINLLQGMAPDVPVHFVLEVTGPTEGAVSFEFKFL